VGKTVDGKAHQRKVKTQFGHKTVAVKPTKVRLSDKPRKRK
jgi:hypothetical protein